MLTNHKLKRNRTIFKLNKTIPRETLCLAQLTIVLLRLCSIFSDHNSTITKKTDKQDCRKAFSILNYYSFTFRAMTFGTVDFQT